MTTYSYLDYETEKEANEAAGSPLITRFPPGWAGSRVNDSLAAMASAIRNLGDVAAKYTLDSEGVPDLGPNGGRIGSMAWQSADDVDIEGGRLGASVRGSVPARVVLPWFGTFPELEAQYPNLRTRGFDICDGRTSTNPVNASESLVMPNLLDNYIYFYGQASHIGAIGLFAHDKTTSENGAHDHGGSVTGTALTGAQVPTLSQTKISVESGGGATVVSNVAYGGPGSGFTAAVTGAVGHTHTVNVRPRAAGFVPIMRVW